MNIGFDLDKIFINFPPIVPSKIVELLYKGKSNHELKYRIPSRIEQIIRVLSHHPLFRQPIAENINYVKNLALKSKNRHYLISSRFSFLKKRTNDLIRLHHFDKIFHTMYFNYENKQPHQFKNEIMKKLNLDMYVDDDLQLLEYLINKNPNTKFFWLNKKISKPLKKNLFAIKHIAEMIK
ncbi:MAG: hypothetical protein Q8P65_00520 [bacterium]|nr:hypothetical protein [bacterium]